MAEDMEVVCFDKIDSSAIANIPTIYIEQPVKKWGKKRSMCLWNKSRDLTQ